VTGYNPAAEPWEVKTRAFGTTPTTWNVPSRPRGADGADQLLANGSNLAIGLDSDCHSATEDSVISTRAGVSSPGARAGHRLLLVGSGLVAAYRRRRKAADIAA